MHNPGWHINKTLSDKTKYWCGDGWDRLIGLHDSNCYLFKGAAMRHSLQLKRPLTPKAQESLVSLSTSFAISSDFKPSFQGHPTLIVTQASPPSHFAFLQKTWSYPEGLYKSWGGPPMPPPLPLCSISKAWKWPTFSSRQRYRGPSWERPLAWPEAGWWDRWAFMGDPYVLGWKWLAGWRDA